MCGRYVVTTDADELAERFEILDDRDPRASRTRDAGASSTAPDDDRQQRIRYEGEPSWNVAPTATVPAVVRHDGRRFLTGFRWGLVPFWADDPKIGARLINARSETVTTKNAFAESFRRRRCLLPADGFYEWSRAGGQKLPWFVERTDDDLMAFAGIWASWRPKAAPDTPEDERPERLLTCSILTTSANATLSGIHDRMPVILDRDAQEAWLDDDAAEAELTALLAPAPDDAVRRFRVTTDVNSVANDRPDLVERVAEDQGVPADVEPAVEAGPIGQPSLFDG